jgi:hypothetical protein
MIEPEHAPRVFRALGALGDLPEDLDLPGRRDVAAALACVASALDELEEPDDMPPPPKLRRRKPVAPLPLFAWAATDRKSVV